MKMQFVQGFVSATAETAEESLALMNFAMHLGKETAGKKLARRAAQAKKPASPSAEYQRERRKLAKKRAAARAYYHAHKDEIAAKRKAKYGANKTQPVAINRLSDAPATATSFLD